MKTNEALQLNQFLQLIAKECTGKLGYAVARNIRLLNTELTEYTNQRNDLIKKYGAEKDGQIVIERDSKEFELFAKELSTYDDIEVEISFMKVKEEEFEKSGLSADKMMVLMDFMLEE